MPWPTKKLGEIIELHYGKGIAQHDRKPNGRYSIYGANGELGRTDKFLVEGDAIIIGRKGTAGEITRVSGRFWPADVTYYVFGNEKVDVNYLFYVLKKLDLKRLATGVKPGINRNKVYELEIPLPPLSEQKRIVEKIEKLFAKIDEVERLRAESLAASAALLTSALHQVFSRAKKENWEMRKIEDSCKLPSPQIKGIPRKQYKSVGKFPIIDQSAEFIAGYTNDEHKVYNKTLPVIVFGDHTLIFKFVDFDFVSGADGTKILIPNKDFEPKYFYYALQGLNLKSLGYSRHFKILRSKTIPLPSLAEQKKIVAYLDALSQKSQELQKLQQQTAADFSALRQSVLAQAFNQNF